MGRSSANGNSDEGGAAGGAGLDTLSGDQSLPATHESGDDVPGPAGAADPGVLARGSAVGRYVVLEKLGAGAMGVVYGAYDPELDRKVALKLLRAQEESANRTRREARMVREAKAIARISHPNVVAVHDVGVHDGQVFMAMEHLPGGTLRAWMAPENKRAWRDVVRMFIEIGRGLAGAHAEGLIHRDFKPDNVLIDKNGVPKVVDFGLVRLSAATTESSMSGTHDDGAPRDVAAPPALPVAAGPAALTRTGALTGTPAYMASEQFTGKTVDGRTDQFAFCVSLYEALYGARPFPGDNIIALADSVTSGRVREAPKDSPVPTWVRRVLLRGLSVEPDKRFATFDELIAILAKDPARRNRKWAAGGATVVAALAAVGVAHRVGSGERMICKRGPTHLAGIWDASPAGNARKAGIHRAFTATGKSYAEQAFQGASRLIDQYANRWIGMYTEACEATQVRGEQSAEVMDLRMACLKERLGNARALTDVFVAADGKVVENAVSAAAALPSLDRCADVRLLRAVVKPPEDAATRARVDELRGELAKMTALRDSGQCARATSKAGDLISNVRAVDYQPLVAESLYESAQVGSSCGDVAEALQRFKDAHVAANASHNDEIAAQASALIPPFAVNRLGQASVAREWLVVAQGDVARLGRETLAEAMLAQAEGVVALSDRAFERALAAGDRSIAITRKLLGPDDPLTITWESNKGMFEEMAGRIEEALKTYVHTREHLERVLGPEHPRVALVSNNEGEVLNMLGRHAEAEVAYRRAVQLFRQSGADTDVLGWSLTGLGRALLGQEHTDAAVAPLEEALAIRLEKRPPPELMGETRFALARALWSRPATRRRALTLATDARADYDGDKKAAAEIDAWLAQARAEKL